MDKTKNIILVSIIVIFIIAIIGVIFYGQKFTQKPAPIVEEKKEIPLYEITTTTSTLAETSEKQEIRVFCKLEDEKPDVSPFVIEGCVKEINQIDKEREKKALDIIKKYSSGELVKIYGPTAVSLLEDLYEESIIKGIIVSSNKYQVIKIYHTDVPARFILAIVDTIEGKITDILDVKAVVKVFKDKIVFLEFIKDKNYKKIEEVIKQYKYGTKKALLISDSEIKSPLTYFFVRGPYETGVVKVVTSTENTLTLNIYDETKIIKDDGWEQEYKQVGTKVIKLPD
jgi:hypothetical protein